MSFISLLVCLAVTLNPVFLDRDAVIDKYVKEFNADDEELYSQVFTNDKAAQFLKDNIPLFDCPDSALCRTYYFRWWTYRKHIKATPHGYIITEFLPPVRWAGEYNSISCGAMHHFSEGRWLKDSKYLDDYIKFWANGPGKPRKYSFPASDGFLRYYLAHPDKELLADVYGGLKKNYGKWGNHRDSTGLYWQSDDRDGMELSISGRLSTDHTGYRPTINSYMYADAKALETMARILGNAEDEKLFKAKADTLKALIDNNLWDEKARFYKVIPRNGKFELSPVRELLGYVPWVYGVPDADKTDAWLQLMDEKGFKAKFGPTSAEQRAEGFEISYTGKACKWNGPSWPFATSQTLDGMADCLRRFGEATITKKDFMEVLDTYSNSHRMVREDGRTVCWIDEDLNPFTGDWIARTMILKGRGIKERGKDYNHSTFCDLVISNLIGLRPQLDGSLIVEPLLPEGQWDWFCLSDVHCAGHKYSIVYDKTGKHYRKGKGLRIYKDGKQVFKSKSYAVMAAIR